MSYLSFSFDMPNYKQHRVSLNKKQYRKLIDSINLPINKVKNKNTNKNLTIVEELYLKINSTEYKNIDDRYSKVEKINVFKRVFEERKDFVLANLWGIKRPEYELKAEQGDANAQYNMALLYQAGKSVPKDPEMAEMWYARAAVQGDVRAQYKLARMYYDGQGVPQNYGAALKWFTKAAEYGHAHAQHTLGLMFYKGQGVSMDKNTANKWWKRASRQGYMIDDKPSVADKPK
jgi:TPR repeat protein